MVVYKCPGCEWSYVLSDSEVYGPIFEDGSALVACVMSMDEFKDGYADCTTGLKAVK